MFVYTLFIPFYTFHTFPLYFAWFRVKEGQGVVGKGLSVTTHPSCTESALHGASLHAASLRDASLHCASLHASLLYAGGLAEATSESFVEGGSIALLGLREQERVPCVTLSSKRRRHTQARAAFLAYAYSSAHPKASHLL